ncbi:MAG: diguanylate cyclase [Mariprofundaceae bacterium]|nr:diguanylate cyclase [Mariprofundaceae bacterium]
MKRVQEDPRRVLILGAGEGGTALLEMLQEEVLVNVVGVADIKPDAKGMALARKLGIPIFSSVESAIADCAPCVAFNLTGNEMVETVVAESLGVGGVIGGLEARLIVRMVNQLKQSKEQLHYEATHDPLTGAYNRRHLQTLLSDGLAQASRYHVPYSVALLDLDHFKQVNDTYGHPAGDAVLKTVVQTLRAGVRDVDVIGRWGGEEFLILLPHTNHDEAILAAEHWLEWVSTTAIELPDGQTIRVSFSAGIASYKTPDDTRPMTERIEALLREADQSLYAAKRSGRNKVCGSPD